MLVVDEMKMLVVDEMKMLVDDVSGQNWIPSFLKD